MFRIACHVFKKCRTIPFISVSETAYGYVIKVFGTLFVLGFRHDKCNPRGLSKEQKGVPGEFKTLKKKNFFKNKIKFLLLPAIFCFLTGRSWSGD